MNVVLIGSGGREHAIALSVSKSKLIDKLFIIPGNPGTGKLGTNVNLDIKDSKLIMQFCQSNFIDLVIVGPEQPLIDGLADQLTTCGIKVFGPSKEAARIEGEKSYAKNLMKDYGIPTAAYKIFYKNDYEKALTYLDTIKYPVVIKADGIAAGKGVVVAENHTSAKSAIDNCFVNYSFGKSGDKIIIEEFMTGQEASIFAITDGTEFILLPAAQDHKRIFDGDKGKNTGGMGAYAPTPFVSEEILNVVSQKIIIPTLQAMRDKGANYSGCLYCGLMLTIEGPKVIEYNCRFGDPETQVVLPLLDGDFLELLFSTASGKINKSAVKYNSGASACVVLASAGYPDEYENGKVITGIENADNENVIVYHAGTSMLKESIVTNGGRVLGVTSVINRNNLSLAKQICYDAISKINFDGMQFRKDICDKAIVSYKQK
jgi:phosphoribosylamine--glycine ligase